MAFTEAQKVSIRTYLCFPLGYYDLNTRLESMIDKVGSSDPEQDHIEALLASLALVETAIATSGTSSSARGALKAVVGDVEWYDISSSSSADASVPARAYGKILINRLAACFGFRTDEIPANFFATGSSSGNEIRLG